MNHEQAVQLYRAAIDPLASLEEGKEWWAAVKSELEAVIAAKSVSAGARVIEWWHHDWSSVQDRPADAARRIRFQAKHLKIK
ncbi:hypothetical protein FA341_14980 [Pseudomonas aeruginosa]|uniref:Uncharacterized protein n=1 Tax=Pseudomonas aeruginosa TaxID=287 RepID=A0A6C0L351_PSEAI|nr:MULTISPECIES: hypothetical protein [Pseudomonas aeruginosa group]EIU2642904.1 hypothetical protein [Pseudomonas aeruginosa]EIU9543918.1 hypothetical protein [Pseudomonas aeruginosa]EIU9551351.1 hypothetical protein [Pseudomonas aeruginosa]EJY6032795.1 hypothetical protein [Pseudomonas aeruginosa]EKC7897021.1 hypothetical protein [Pseudomonas aeruginosa]